MQDYVQRLLAIRRALSPPDAYGLVLSSSGVVLVAFRDRFDWQIADEHWQAVVGYLVTGDDSEIEEFVDATVAGYELMSDPLAVANWLSGSREASDER